MNSIIECRATRHGRSWVAYDPDHGAYGHGRTLKRTRESITQALALLGIDAEVTLIPMTPELEKLRAAQDACAAALGEAVAALALRRAPAHDIAAATGAATSQVRLLLAERAQDTNPVAPAADAGPVQDGPVDTGGA